MKNNKSLFSLHSNNSPPSFLFQKDEEGRIQKKRAVGVARWPTHDLFKGCYSCTDVYAVLDRLFYLRRLTLLLPENPALKQAAGALHSIADQHTAFGDTVVLNL